METITEPPRQRRPFSKAKPRKELLAQIQRAQRLREIEGQKVHEEHVEIILPVDESKPEPPPPRPRPFPKARPRKELLAQIKRAQDKRHEEQSQENIPPTGSLHGDVDKRTQFDKLVDRLDHEGRVLTTSHPRSALEAILNEGGRDYNDSTIASLENIIHPVLDTPPQPRDDERISTEKQNPRTREKQRSNDLEQDEDVLASLSKQLYSTQNTIKDANRGLRRISNKIGATEAPPSIENAAPTDGGAKPASVKIEPPAEPVRKVEFESKSKNFGKPESAHGTQAAVAEPRIGTKTHTENPSNTTISRKVDHDGRTICAHCGGQYTSVWRALWGELRDNFYTYDLNSRFYISLTWLGSFTAVFLVWLTIESFLCLTWCDNVHGPLMPFVTHYVVLQPFKPYLKPYWRFLGWIVSTIFNLDQGRTVPGYGRSIPVAHTYTAAATAARATKRVVRSAMEAVDEMGSIWDDEWI